MPRTPRANVGANVGAPPGAERARTYGQPTRYVDGTVKKVGI